MMKPRLLSILWLKVQRLFGFIFGFKVLKASWQTVTQRQTVSKVVFLRLGQGNLQHGFPYVEMRLQDGGKLIVQKTGCLPAAAVLAHRFTEWQFFYEAFYEEQRYRLRGTDVKALKAAPAGIDEPDEIEFETTGITGFSEQEFRTIAATVSAEMQIWLNAPGLLEINNVLRTWLQVDEAIRVIIETHDPRLQQLPWHCWQFFADYRNAEPSFSAPEFEQRRGRSQRRKPRILAVLGNRDGIDSTAEEAFLQQLKAEAIFLVEPSLQALTEVLRHPKGWDIFFFAGHSSSQTGGQFFLNATETVTIDDLRYALQKAISEGLTLAIFNSCDGSKLAQALQGLNLPTVIVMKEPVPNQVAQDFLRSFLQSFAAGASLPTAVREARESLQGSEREFPCASWLPGIWQNPAAPSPLWRDFEALPLPHPLQRLRWQTVLAMSLVVTGLVMGARSLGWLEPLELWAYDRCMAMRPLTEQPDSRLLIVGVTEADLEQYGTLEPMASRRILSDRIVATILKTLNQSKPRVIGLDIIRDIPIGDGQAELLKELRRQGSGIISSCQIPGDDRQTDPGLLPPLGIFKEQLGFINFPEEPGDIVRRQFLGMGPKDNKPGTCNTSLSLSMRLAARYLGFQDVGATAQRTAVQLGRVEVPVLRESFGGYRSKHSKLHLQYGYQLLLNYRASEPVAKQVTLKDLLTGAVAADWINDKLILIGYTATSAKDESLTPYNSEGWAEKKMPGVVIHAHMISQILSAVENQRPLLHPWSEAGESAWILVWAGVGGLLFKWWKSLRLAAITTIALGILGVSSFIWFCSGTWVPLVPAATALMGSAGILVIGSRFKSFRSASVKDCS
jgi:CHASE2 domain-containing sensor protein